MDEEGWYQLLIVKASIFFFLALGEALIYLLGFINCRPFEGKPDESDCLYEQALIPSLFLRILVYCSILKFYALLNPAQEQSSYISQYI